MGCTRLKPCVTMDCWGSYWMCNCTCCTLSMLTKRFDLDPQTSLETIRGFTLAVGNEQLFRLEDFDNGRWIVRVCSLTPSLRKQTKDSTFKWSKWKTATILLSSSRRASPMVSSFMPESFLLVPVAVVTCGILKRLRDEKYTANCSCPRQMRIQYLPRFHGNDLKADELVSDHVPHFHLENKCLSVWGHNRIPSGQLFIFAKLQRLYSYQHHHLYLYWYQCLYTVKWAIGEYPSTLFPNRKLPHRLKNPEEPEHHLLRSRDFLCGSN